MFNRALAAVSAAAFGLALAVPAAALTLVFDVDVETADGVPGFAPVSFRQTWTFEPGTASGFNVFGLTGQSLQGTASATASPLAPNLALDLMAFPGVLSASGGYDFRSGVFVFPDPFGGAPFIGPTVTILDANQERRADVDVLGHPATHYDRMTLHLGSNSPYPVDEAGLLAFIASAPFVGWTEAEGLRVAGSDSVVKTYSGIARLAAAVVDPGGPPVPPPVTGVPEPAGWALMIVGFGGVGALARRRRGALA
jgi:hypothetical protein